MAEQFENFPFPLTGTFTDNGRRFALAAPFVFVDGEVKVEVPAGFVTDFNSVPRGLWNFFPPWEYPEAGVIHDFLYRFNGMSRACADVIHLRILELKGASWWKRYTAYAGIRVGGGAAWDRYRQEEQR